MAKSLYEFCLERDDFILLVQWDKKKNGSLTPRDVPFGSHKKAWWCCEFGHQWDAAVYSRTGAGSGCPYCKGKKLLPFYRTPATEFPDLVKQWHPTKNIGLSPQDVPPATHRKVWWVCENGHEWQAQINARTRGTGCPVCSNRKIVEGENDLATTHPDLAQQWDYEKNAPLTPQKVVAGNSIKVWWRCSYGHEYRSSILSRTSGNNSCPVCAGKKVIRGENDLADSFPALAAQWHPVKNGTLTPDKVTPFSNRRVWWQCAKGHEYQATIAQRTQKSSECPYCTNRKVLAGFNDLATLEPQVAAQWHAELNGILAPEMVTPGSHRKVWWQCGEGHVWKAVIYSRTGGQKSGCPVCAGKAKASKPL